MCKRSSAALAMCSCRLLVSVTVSSIAQQKAAHFSAHLVGVECGYERSMSYKHLSDSTPDAVHTTICTNAHTESTHQTSCDLWLHIVLEIVPFQYRNHDGLQFATGRGNIQNYCTILRMQLPNKITCIAIWQIEQVYNSILPVYVFRSRAKH